ncbi:GvpL/GvpF family gas vesicle protein [Streptomyces albipurpureus]|uniref:GvpL/GvpF family gas vesicle protein n=1 Tax=Streptomyces albipurpureus TaxID=2897419 RepID=A0ABT0UPX0_9ACTN|nr:GvpL/GvpF family gas vesicle protein [Streptomyces sp. CWNU-1]MCM2390657.1 GvpL/GvpF family gas vesicle protein [Streptomyces sp. CWNU-1]
MSVYVYGIAASAHPDLPENAAGIGDPPRPVRIVSQGRIKALVSDAPEKIRPKRRDLLAHQDVLRQAGESGPVLPLRFGGVSPDDETLLSVLAEKEEYYVERLAALDGMVEYNLKATHDEEAVLYRVLSDDPALRESVEAGRRTGGGSHEDKVRLGERVAQAVQTREVQDADLVRATLRNLSEEVSAGPKSVGWLANLSFLVARDRSAELVNAVDVIRQENPHLVLTVTGPLPPYSFVE